jgi:hypothetical protein
MSAFTDDSVTIAPPCHCGLAARCAAICRAAAWGGRSGSAEGRSMRRKATTQRLSLSRPHDGLLWAPPAKRAPRTGHRAGARPRSPSRPPCRSTWLDRKTPLRFTARTSSKSCASEDTRAGGRPAGGARAGHPAPRGPAQPRPSLAVARPGPAAPTCSLMSRKGAARTMPALATCGPRGDVVAHVCVATSVNRH